MQHGGCLCGAVRYKVEGNPILGAICHCRTCRKAVSAPTLPFTQFPLDAFAFTQGDPVEYRSSPPVIRSFCGRCGSQLTYRSDLEAGCIDIMTCSLDDPEVFAPTFHVWAAEKLKWDVIADGRPAFKSIRAAGEQI